MPKAAVVTEVVVVTAVVVITEVVVSVAAVFVVVAGEGMATQDRAAITAIGGVG
jgi:hypothetical protein